MSFRNVDTLNVCSSFQYTVLIDSLIYILFCENRKFDSKAKNIGVKAFVHFKVLNNIKSTYL